MIAATVSAKSSPTTIVSIVEKPSGGGQLPPMHLICISVTKGEVTNTPLVSGLPLGINTLNEMNYVVET